MGYQDQDHYKQSGQSRGVARKGQILGHDDDDKPWWAREMELLDQWDEQEYKGRSVSNAKQFLGHHAWGERTFGNDNNGKLNAVTGEVARLMNTVLNAQQGKEEKVLSLSWSKGKMDGQNAPNSSAIVLNPDLI